MLPSFKLETYQDVKKTLIWYTSALLVIILFLFYSFVLFPDQRCHIDVFLNRIKIFSFIGSTTLFVVIVFLSWLFISIFEIHDKIYDRYFIKWRHLYSISIIIPELFKPFSEDLPNDFLKVAKSHEGSFIKIFYYFVGDYDTKISINLLIRFYEKITKYWITQINEILLILLFILILSLRVFLVIKNTTLLKNGAFMNNSISVIGFIIIIFMLNRLYVRQSKNEVQIATIEEIKDIHAKYRLELFLKAVETYLRYERL